MKKISTFLISFVSFFLFSCGSTQQIPSWVTPDWTTAFPNSRFLAQRGVAESAETAKTEALSQLSQYIRTNVNANITTSVTHMERNKKVTDSALIQTDVAIQSNVELFGVEYTVPFYVKSEKRWYCVAYINRERAWTQYVPKIELAKNLFYSFYNSARVEGEPFFIMSDYKNAWEHGKEFLTTLEYGRLIHPDRERMYAADRAKLAEIPVKIDNERRQIAIQLNIQGDYNGIITTALENAFKKSGLTVSKKGNYMADVEIKPNSDGKSPLAVYPEIDLKLTASSGQTVYSYKDRLSERTVAYSLETAQKKAYPVFARQIEENIYNELSHLKETR